MAAPHFSALLNVITTADARDLAQRLPDNSVDLVFADPPYLKEHIEDGIYAWLAEVAARVLKENGFCLAYCGTYWKYQAMLQMGRYLEYFWDYGVLFPGGPKGMHYGRRTMPMHTPILAFRKGKAMPTAAVLDLYKGSGASKKFHKWGQDAPSAQYFLSCFSHPGDLVFDPFTGGGTIPVVCTLLGRDFIACEIDAAQAQIARARLALAQQLPLMPPDSDGGVYRLLGGVA